MDLQLNICCIFYAYCKIISTQFYGLFVRNDPAYVRYTKVEHFCLCSFNIRVLKFSKFNIKVYLTYVLGHLYLILTVANHHQHP